MKNWKLTLMSPRASILEALKIIDNSSLQIALVVDENKKLLGTVTDGDIRRATLRKVSLENPVSSIMFASPTVASINDDKEKIASLMYRNELRHIPLIDSKGCVAGVKILLEMIKPHRKDTMVVLMAGGSGKRLRPLTEDYPKPMLEIGGKPLLETILEGLINHGYRRFSIAVNYRAKIIEDHFGDGSRWGADINYLREEEKMGTAGALSLLKEKPESAILVMNADLLTKVNFQQLFYFHSEQKARATMAVREYAFQIPYGVIHVEDNKLLDLDEKPVQRFFVNAGIYVLEPEVLDLIPSNGFFNMTDLFAKLLAERLKVTTFPIREYWVDIGQIGDFERASRDYVDIFQRTESP